MQRILYISLALVFMFLGFSSCQQDICATAYLQNNAAQTLEVTFGDKIATESLVGHKSILVAQYCGRETYEKTDLMRKARIISIKKGEADIKKNVYDPENWKTIRIDENTLQYWFYIGEYDF